jgi:ABC-type proline/glycine betaine transport system ATPase subunit
VLILESVIQQFGRVQALGPLTLRVREGRTLALCGPPDAGKTTLLRLLLGLVRPQAGIVMVGGVPASRPHLRSIRRRTGYVAAGGAVFPHLTVAGNATLAARSLSWTRSKCRDRMVELADELRMPAALLNQAPRDLSEVQRRRAWLLRALFLDPDILLLDDPFDRLESLARQELEIDLQRLLAHRPRTVVIASRRIVDGLALTDDIALLRNGAIAQRGSLRELAEAPASVFVREYLRSERGGLGDV